MTERHGSGYGDEDAQRPSGRGAVTERLAREKHGAHEIDLTDEARDEAAGRDGAEDTVARPDAELAADRETSGAFEPAAPTADPPADATQAGSASIFDLDERAKQEDQQRTGYEPALADNGPAGDAAVEVAGDEARGADDGPAGDAAVEVAGDEARGADDGPAGDAAVEVAGDAAAPVGVPAGPSSDAATPGSLLGSFDAGDLRNRFLDIQAGFVDEPRQAVEAAGRLVDDLVQQVIDALQSQRGQLTGTTAEGSTEDLRLALRAYRQFVDRLLGLAD